jgi:glycine/D-amino acid oxidase-like deaminating enzyme
MARSVPVGPVNGEVSFWYAQIGLPAKRAPLPGSIEVDVCIVGAGFTGLWTAYYLKRADPSLRIAVLEREFAGFGASGRNGGWLNHEFAMPRALMAKTHGRPGVLAQQAAMRATVDEVIAVCAAERIDADIVRSGMLEVARSPAQEKRLRAALADARGWYPGVRSVADVGSDGGPPSSAGPEDLVELDAGTLAERVHVAGGRYGTWTPSGARVQPAKLVRGLAAAVTRLGVPIYEDTTVRAVTPGLAETDRGPVRAHFILTCLEGFTPSLRGHRRTWLPLNSAMIATVPLPDDVWDQIGWRGEELLGDSAHAYMYAQRTADGRIALGGRGVPYRYGSRTDVRGATQPATIAQLEAILRDMFPATAGVPIEHAWCGVLGVPRDWSPTVRLDRATGLGTAGGYVGNGVATSNLAGRTLADLILERDTEITRLPWVGHHTRAWEPEPLRYIGAQLVYGLYREADQRESKSPSDRSSPLASVADRLSGRSH